MSDFQREIRDTLDRIEAAQGVILENQDEILKLLARVARYERKEVMKLAEMETALAEARAAVEATDGKVESLIAHNQSLFDLVKQALPSDLPQSVVENIAAIFAKANETAGQSMDAIEATPIP